VIDGLKNNFEQSVVEGKVECLVLSPVINEQGQLTPAGSWISERFGHVACYYGMCQVKGRLTFLN
jgi:hypothetical protein